MIKLSILLYLILGVLIYNSLSFVTITMFFIIAIVHISLFYIYQKIIKDKYIIPSEILVTQVNNLYEEYITGQRKILINKKAASLKDIPEIFMNCINYLERLVGDTEFVLDETVAITKIDALTKVSTRRNFNDYIKVVNNEAFKNCQENQYVFAMLDIDFFKRVNDTYGHQLGDVTLEEFANVLRNNTRTQQDFIARYGGEEFAIIFKRTSIQEGKKAAEKIRIAVEDYLFSITKQEPFMQVTCSIGLSSFPPVSDIEKVIKQADMALYYAKENGRNRVEYYEDLNLSETEKKEILANVN